MLALDFYVDLALAPLSRSTLLFGCRYELSNLYLSTGYIIIATRELAPVETALTTAPGSRYMVPEWHPCEFEAEHAMAISANLVLLT